MANKENNNKRVLIGALIFALLIGMNLVVRNRRSSSQPSTTSPGTPMSTAVPIPIGAPLQTQTSAPLPMPQTTPESKMPVLPDGSPASSNNSLLVPGSELQMLALNNRLEELNQQLQTIEKPYAPPELQINLLLSNYNRFRWKQPEIIATKTASIEPEPGDIIATTTKEVEILGVFRVKGRNKLMIRENSKVYLVNEGEEAPPESIIVQQTASSSYLVFDSGGSTHDLQLKKPSMSGVEKAVEVLRGRNDQQSSFDVRAIETGTETERVFPNQ